MIIGSAGYNLDASADQTFAKCLRVINDALLVKLELIRESFLEADCLAGNYMHQRTTLDTGENSLIEVETFICFLIT